LRTSLGKPTPVTIRILFDSGASSTIVYKELVKKLRIKKDRTTEWQTAIGKFETNEKAKVQFILPEFHESRVIEWNAHVTDKKSNYDLIVGGDLMTELGIKIDYSEQSITWDEVSVPMKSRDATFENSYHLDDSGHAADATDRMHKILDAKYEPADLEEVVESCKHLDDEERDALLSLLKKYESLFDGTLGHWKGEDYDIELKPDAKPYHTRPFSIPKAYEQTLRTEVERLCKIGVLKKVNRSEWGAPTFIIPKKDQTVRFISDFRELNKQIKRKPFPIPKMTNFKEL